MLCYNCRKICLQISATFFLGRYNIMSTWFILSEYFSDWRLNFIMPRGFTNFHKRVPK